VTDNAANMLKAVPDLTKKIDIGLGCFDHLLNLAVIGANCEVNEIAEAIQVININYKINKFYLLFC
jgi:hypothetical protein